MSTKQQCPRCHREARLNVYRINGAARQKMCSVCANVQRLHGDQVQRHYNAKRLEARR